MGSVGIAFYDIIPTIKNRQGVKTLSFLCLLFFFIRLVFKIFYYAAAYLINQI